KVTGSERQRCRRDRQPVNPVTLVTPTVSRSGANCIACRPPRDGVRWRGVRTETMTSNLSGTTDISEPSNEHHPVVLSGGWLAECRTPLALEAVLMRPRDQTARGHRALRWVRSLPMTFSTLAERRRRPPPRSRRRSLPQGLTAHPLACGKRNDENAA